MTISPAFTLALLGQVPPAPAPQPVPPDLLTQLLHDWTVLGPAIAAVVLALILIPVLLKRRRKPPAEKPAPVLPQPRGQPPIDLPPSEAEAPQHQPAQAAHQEVEHL